MSDQSPEVDYRFLLANERTFLAWMRTALALIAGGVALDQFVVVAGARELVTFLGIFAIGLGAIVAVLGIVQWRRADRNMTVKADQPSPVIVGWHPWFRRTVEGSSAHWSVDSATMAVRDGAFASGEWRDLVATEGPYDDAFNVPGKQVNITWPDVMSLSVQSSHPWFVLYDGAEDAICVEPQTQIPNAWIDPVAGEADVARPGVDLHLETKWRWKIR